MIGLKLPIKRFFCIRNAFLFLVGLPTFFKKVSLDYCRYQSNSFFYTHRAILAICSPNCAQIWKGSDRKTVFFAGGDIKITHFYRA